MSKHMGHSIRGVLNTSIQWNQKLKMLKNFVAIANTICLEGRWKSPGGKTKRFDDLNCNFVWLTQNSRQIFQDLFCKLENLFS